MAPLPQQHFWRLLWALCWCIAPLLAYMGLPQKISFLEKNQIFTSLVVFTFWAHAEKQPRVRVQHRLNWTQAGGSPAAPATRGLQAPRSSQKFPILIQSLQFFLKQHDLGMCSKEWEVAFIFKYFTLGNFLDIFVSQNGFYDTVE